VKCYLCNVSRNFCSRNCTIKCKKERGERRRREEERGGERRRREEKE
jgi:hypothetical protein